MKGQKRKQHYAVREQQTWEMGIGYDDVKKIFFETAISGVELNQFFTPITPFPVSTYSKTVAIPSLCSQPREED